MALGTSPRETDSSVPLYHHLILLLGLIFISEIYFPNHSPSYRYAVMLLGQTAEERNTCLENFKSFSLQGSVPLAFFFLFEFSYFALLPPFFFWKTFHFIRCDYFWIVTSSLQSLSFYAAWWNRSMTIISVSGPKKQAATTVIKWIAKEVGRPALPHLKHWGLEGLNPDFHREYLRESLMPTGHCLGKNRYFRVQTYIFLVREV